MAELNRPPSLYDFSKYSCTEVLEDVELYSTQCKVFLDHSPYPGEMKIKLSFKPSPALFAQIKVSIDPNELFLLYFIEPKLYHPDSNHPDKSIEGARSSAFKIINDQYLKFDWRLNNSFQLGGSCPNKNTAITTFHLFNFPELTETAPHILESDNWEVILYPLENIRQAWKKIKKTGGCHLTHMGKLKRKDGQKFTIDEANEQYRLLDAFLTFTSGTRCKPSCETGLDSEGKVVWRKWTVPNCEASPLASWFNRKHPQQIYDLYPLFARLWNRKPEWKDFLHKISRFYAEANNYSNAVELGLTLVQTALERIAYQCLVFDRLEHTDCDEFKISITDFDDSHSYPANRKIRRTMKGLRIPIEIPNEATYLKKASPKLKTKKQEADIPTAITKFRNDFIHPEQKLSELNPTGKLEAYQLGLWCIELSILSLCNYKGTYNNKRLELWKNEEIIEFVPWHVE